MKNHTLSDKDKYPHVFCQKHKVWTTLTPLLIRFSFMESKWMEFQVNPFFPIACIVTLYYILLPIIRNRKMHLLNMVSLKLILFRRIECFFLSLISSKQLSHFTESGEYYVLLTVSWTKSMFHCIIYWIFFFSPFLSYFNFSIW